MAELDMTTPPPKKRSLTTIDPRTKARNAAEKRFRAYGVIAISIGLLFLAILAVSIVRAGRASVASWAPRPRCQSGSSFAARRRLSWQRFISIPP